MQNEFQIQGSCLTIILPSELDHPAADHIRRETDRILGRCCIRTILFNFQNTNFMDSSGIGMILGRYKALGMRNGCVRVAGTSERIEKILKLSGLYRILEPGEREKSTEKKGENRDGKHE